MYFGLSDDQIFFQDNVKKFLEDNAPLDVIKKIAKMLGDVQKTPEWEAVRKRNAWVNIYNPDKKFVKFLEKQTVEMTGLLKNLGVIK